MMDQSTKLSVQKGGGCEREDKINDTIGLDPILDFLIDAAIVEWVEAHPGEISRYGDADCICKFFGNSKVIYL